mmetsp:Transcript_4983/g.8443  ORF Transcript_4983/g.8443 Transcript_4983/m.8443 type:complete len:376 (+) Transcript_4983:32-1159(+)|eukprot:CAMPEP_0197036634 /NCGR_PEP_ID=MMETSP1384-20130603/14091_1 /TAXON_ID=29189 /ORGANISM="Ammonia sp." /LENGTH=375 /DNA_ID=CAMNT_0042466831 /DNA_START=27 /DNA_END=1154 /DNA_ORIENTATION=-
MAQAKPQETQSQATFKLTKLKEAHLSSITCVDWSSALPNRIMSGSEDKFIKIWDIRSKKCGISWNLTAKGEVTDIASHQHTIWAAASDCKVYEFDTRMIRQKKDIVHFLECKDEISEICYDSQCNALFIGDDHGKVTKYSLQDKKVTDSVLYHQNALCTAVTSIPRFQLGFCGGTDAMLYQFNCNKLEDAFAYSMQDMMSKHNTLTANHGNGKSAKSELTVNPPFIYSLDSKVLKDTDAVKQALVAIALGNGAVALYAPYVGDASGGGDEKKQNEEQQEEEEIVNDPVCVRDMHQSAVSDISFGYHNDWLVSAGTDKFLMISEWKLDESNSELAIESKFRIPLTEKPNSMVCTGNDIAQIVVADLSNNLSMYALK